MEKKKALCFLMLSMTILIVGLQIGYGSSVFTQQVINESDISIDTKIPFITNLRPNAINFTITGSIESVWFYVNLVAVVLTPIAIILPFVLIKNKKEDEVVVSDDPETKPQIDAAFVEPTGNLLARIGMLVLFIQNVIILLMYILFFVLIPTYTNPDIPLNILRTYFFLFDIDFIAAILITIGLVLSALKTQKSQIIGFIGAGMWIIFIGVAIYPRIELITGLTGGLGSTFNFDAFFEYLTNFYGPDIFLRTLGHCFFLLGIMFTTKYFSDNDQLKAKGLINAFGITNYTVGGLMNILLLLVLTFGLNMTGEAVISLLILYFILFLIKFTAVPLLGLIAGIIGFNRMNPKKLAKS